MPIIMKRWASWPPPKIIALTPSCSFSKPPNCVRPNRCTGRGHRFSGETGGSPFMDEHERAKPDCAGVDKASASRKFAQTAGVCCGGGLLYRRGRLVWCGAMVQELEVGGTRI